MEGIEDVQQMRNMKKTVKKKLAMDKVPTENHDTIEIDDKIISPKLKQGKRKENTPIENRKENDHSKISLNDKSKNHLKRPKIHKKSSAVFVHKLMKIKNKSWRSKKHSSEMFSKNFSSSMRKQSTSYTKYIVDNKMSSTRNISINNETSMKKPRRKTQDTSSTILRSFDVRKPIKIDSCTGPRFKSQSNILKLSKVFTKKHSRTFKINSRKKDSSTNMKDSKIRTHKKHTSTSMPKYKPIALEKTPAYSKQSKTLSSRKFAGEIYKNENLKEREIKEKESTRTTHNKNMQYEQKMYFKIDTPLEIHKENDSEPDTVFDNMNISSKTWSYSDTCVYRMLSKHKVETEDIVLADNKKNKYYPLKKTPANTRAQSKLLQPKGALKQANKAEFAKTRYEMKIIPKIRSGKSIYRKTRSSSSTNKRVHFAKENEYIVKEAYEGTPVRRNKPIESEGKCTCDSADEDQAKRINEPIPVKRVEKPVKPHRPKDQSLLKKKEVNEESDICSHRGEIQRLNRKKSNNKVKEKNEVAMKETSKETLTKTKYNTKRIPKKRYFSNTSINKKVNLPNRNEGGNKEVKKITHVKNNTRFKCECDSADDEQTKSINKVISDKRSDKQKQAECIEDQSQLTEEEMNDNSHVCSHNEDTTRANMKKHIEIAKEKYKDTFNEIIRKLPKSYSGTSLHEEIVIRRRNDQNYINEKTCKRKINHFECDCTSERPSTDQNLPSDTSVSFKTHFFWKQKYFNKNNNKRKISATTKHDSQTCQKQYNIEIDKHKEKSKSQYRSKSFLGRSKNKGDKIQLKRNISSLRTSSKDSPGNKLKHIDKSTRKFSNVDVRVYSGSSSLTENLTQDSLVEPCSCCPKILINKENNQVIHKEKPTGKFYNEGVCSCSSLSSGRFTQGSVNSKDRFEVCSCCSSIIINNENKDDKENVLKHRNNTQNLAIILSSDSNSPKTRVRRSAAEKISSSSYEATLRTNRQSERLDTINKEKRLKAKDEGITCRYLPDITEKSQETSESSLESIVSKKDTTNGAEKKASKKMLGAMRKLPHLRSYSGNDRNFINEKTCTRKKKHIECDLTNENELPACDTCVSFKTHFYGKKFSFNKFKNRRKIPATDKNNLSTFWKKYSKEKFYSQNRSKSFLNRSKKKSDKTSIKRNLSSLKTSSKVLPKNKTKTKDVPSSKLSVEDVCSTSASSTGKVTQDSFNLQDRFERCSCCSRNQIYNENKHVKENVLKDQTKDKVEHLSDNISKKHEHKCTNEPNLSGTKNQNTKDSGKEETYFDIEMRQTLENNNKQNRECCSKSENELFMLIKFLDKVGSELCRCSKIKKVNESNYKNEEIETEEGDMENQSYHKSEYMNDEKNYENRHKHSIDNIDTTEQNVDCSESGTFTKFKLNLKEGKKEKCDCCNCETNNELIRLIRNLNEIRPRYCKYQKNYKSKGSYLKQDTVCKESNIECQNKSPSNYNSQVYKKRYKQYRPTISVSKDVCSKNEQNYENKKHKYENRNSVNKICEFKKTDFRKAECRKASRKENYHECLRERLKQCKKERYKKCQQKRDKQSQMHSKKRCYKENQKTIDVICQCKYKSSDTTADNLKNKIIAEEKNEQNHENCHKKNTSYHQRNICKNKQLNNKTSLNSKQRVKKQCLDETISSNLRESSGSVEQNIYYDKNKKVTSIAELRQKLEEIRNKNCDKCNCKSEIALGGFVTYLDKVIKKLCSFSETTYIQKTNLCKREKRSPVEINSSNICQKNEVNIQTDSLTEKIPKRKKFVKKNSCAYNVHKIQSTDTFQKQQKGFEKESSQGSKSKEREYTSAEIQTTKESKKKSVAFKKESSYRKTSEEEEEKETSADRIKSVDRSLKKQVGFKRHFSRKEMPKKQKFVRKQVSVKSQTTHKSQKKHPGFQRIFSRRKKTKINYEMDLEASCDMNCTLPAKSNSLSPKCKERYLSMYENFIKWDAGVSGKKKTRGIEVKRKVKQKEKGVPESFGDTFKKGDSVNCKCRIKLTKNQELSAYRSDFRGMFRDGCRLIDLMVVVKDDGDKRAEELRLKFLVSALQLGLEMELERGIMPINNQLLFIKVHATGKVLEKFGELYNIRKYYRHQHANCAHYPEREFLELIRDNYEKPTYYSSLERSLIVYKMLLHLPFGSRYKDYGINKLISRNIFRDVYALHDGPSFLVKCQSPSYATGRQSLLLMEIRTESRVGPYDKVRIKNHLKINKSHPSLTTVLVMFNESYFAEKILFHNWAVAFPFQVFKSMPFSLLNEYMGERVAYYFAFAEYYNRGLFCLSLMSLIFIGLQIGRFIYFPTQDAKQMIDVFCNYTFFVCPECIHSQEKCILRFMAHYCYTTMFLRMLDDGRLVYYAVVVCLWAIIFAYKWRVRELKLMWKWENTSGENKSEVRPMHRKLPAVYREPEYRVTYYIRVFTSTILVIGLVLLWCAFCQPIHLENKTTKIPLAAIFVEKLNEFVTEKILKKILKDSWDEVKTMVEIDLAQMFLFSLFFLSIGMLVGVILKWIAYFLTSCEGHTVFTLYERSLAHKLFLISSVTVYPSLVYHGLLKTLGFDTLRFVPELPKFSPLDQFDVAALIAPNLWRTCGPSGSCLHHIATILLAAWVVHQILYPLIKYISRWLFNVKDWRRRVPVWETEYLLPPMTDKMIMDRYDYLVIQFGLCTLFIIAVPILPIFSALLNLYDFRYSARLFLCSHRRPLLPKYAGIGTWRNILMILALVTVFFHALIISNQTVIAENIAFHNYYHWEQHDIIGHSKMNWKLLLPPYCRYFLTFFPMNQFKIGMKDRADTIGENSAWFQGDGCLYSGQHSYSREFSKDYEENPSKDAWTEHKYVLKCGSECSNVRRIRIQVFLFFVIFVAVSAAFIISVLDPGAETTQIKVQETRIQRAFYQGDQVRGLNDRDNYRILACPTGESSGCLK